MLCSGGCGMGELVSHLFLNCNFYKDVWSFILRWLGISNALLSEIALHASQFGGNHLFRKDIRTCLQIIWLASNLIIWKEHNFMIFQKKESAITEIVDTVKFHSWWWLKVYKPHTFFDFHAWWTKPLVCLGYSTL